MLNAGEKARNLLRKVGQFVSSFIDRLYLSTPPYRLTRGDWLTAALVVLPFLVLYLFTCSHAPNLAGDSPEMIGGAYSLGILHPPGYPTYTLVGYLFTHLPLGSIAFRLNLFSVIIHTFTLFLLFVVLVKMTASRSASALTVFILGVSPLFWFYSLVAEVFPLNDFFAILLILVAMLARERWLQGRTDGARRLALLLVFLCGLSLTHHQTIILVFPAALLIAARPLGHLLSRFRGFMASTGLFLLGLLPYAYLPLRAARKPYMNFGDPSTLSSFINVVTRRVYGTTKLWIGPQAEHRLDMVFEFLKSLDAQMYLLGMALALLGAWHMARRRRGDFYPLLVSFLLAGLAFPLLANVSLHGPFERSTIERFYLLPLILLCPFLAMGWQYLLRLLKRGVGLLKVRPGLRRVLVAALVALLAMPFYLPLRRTYDRVQLREDIIPETYIRELLSGIEDGAVLILSGDIPVELVDFYYRNCVPERRQVITIVWSFWGLPWYMEHLRKWYPELDLPKTGETEELFSKRLLYYKGALMEYLMENNPQVPAFYTVEKNLGLRDEYRYVPFGFCYRIVPGDQDLDYGEIYASLTRFYDDLPPVIYELSSYASDRRELFMAHFLAMHVHEAASFFREAGQLERAIAINTVAFNIFPFQEYEFETAEMMYESGNLQEAAALFWDYAASGSYFDRHTWESLVRLEEIERGEGAE